MTARDMADFFKLTAVCGVADRSEVARWADSIIVASDVAPQWSIDISLAADGSDLIGLLGAVPGEPTQRLAGLMLLGRLHRLRTRGELSGPIISRRLYSLSLDGVFPDEVEHEISLLDDGFGLAETGVWSTADAESALTKLLARFSDYDPFKSTAA